MSLSIFRLVCASVAALPPLSAGLAQQSCVLQQCCQHEPGHRVQQRLITKRRVVPVCNKRCHSEAICRVAIELIKTNIVSNCNSVMRYI